MRSHLMVGTVRHRRTGSVGYELRHAVYYLALDLAELSLVRERCRLLSGIRWSPFAFREADHWLPPATDLRGDVLARLVADGFDPRDWRITLVSNLRVMGYVFDPASFYLCRDADGTLRAVVVEVHNTYGERHIYSLPMETHGKGSIGRMAKAFHVSPFLGMDAGYTVWVRDDERRLRIAVVETEPGGPGLVATLDLGRRPLSDRGLVRAFTHSPFVTHRTIAAIHWHAFRLWRRGVPFRRYRGAGI